MIITNYGKGMMGFREHPESDTLQIHFGIILVYSLRGIHFQPSATLKQSKVTSFGKNCSVIIAESPNEASKLLSGDIYILITKRSGYPRKKQNHLIC